MAVSISRRLEYGLLKLADNNPERYTTNRVGWGLHGLKSTHAGVRGAMENNDPELRERARQISEGPRGDKYAANEKEFADGRHNLLSVPWITKTCLSHLISSVDLTFPRNGL